MSAQTEIILIAMLAAFACALPGVFLVLRKMSMVADAITHTVFLGIVIAFFATENLNSPWLLIGATLMGCFTVWCTESLQRTRLVSEDASIGIVFPLLFSIGLILVNLYGSNVHLDTDSVLLGELAFAPFDRVRVNGADWGAVSMWVLAGICLLNTLVIVAAFKEWKLVTFDALLAAMYGFSPIWMHYLLMTLVSVTVVASFQAVGAILVIGLMIGPAATAYLLTKDLRKMLVLVASIGALSAWLGTELAFWLDVSIAGTIAGTIGGVFLLTVIATPKSGIIARYRRLKRLRLQYGEETVLFHLLTHEGTATQAQEAGVGTLYEHLRWKPEFADLICRRLQAGHFVRIHGGTVHLTESGRARAYRVSETLFAEQ